MTVMAIDPGNVQSGFAYWNGEKVLKAGVLPNQQMFAEITNAAFLGVDHLAVEMVGHYGTGMSVGKTVFDTCVAIGEFKLHWAYCCAEAGRKDGAARFHLVLRPTIKAHLCGTAKAKDANVAQSLRDRIGGKGTKANKGPLFGVTSHAIQALALAVYLVDVERIGALDAA